MPRPTPVERDQRMLTFIAAHIDQHGYPPTYREIAAHFNIAIKSVRDSLSRLRAGGALTWQDGHTRTLRIVAAAAP